MLMELNGCVATAHSALGRRKKSLTRSNFKSVFILMPDTTYES